MAKETPSKSNFKGPDPDSPELKQLVRQAAEKYLKDPNINSVGIGLKNDTNEVCIQFTVDKKYEPEYFENNPELLVTELIPEQISNEKLTVKTDVIQRKFEPGFIPVAQVTADPRKIYQNPAQPGISIGNIAITAGTFGAVVYDNVTGEPLILSNWHVLNGDGGAIGDTILQPGTFDDNSNTAQNLIGKLKRSFLGLAGDCAVAAIENRNIKPDIYGLNIIPLTIVNPQLNDTVIKSGRTTGITFGTVRRIEVTVKINYGGITGEQQIGGFEIGYDPGNMPSNGEISMGGDSGSLWLISQNGQPTPNAVGLHFAGEGAGDPDEHAIACNLDSVFQKLEISLTAPVIVPAGGSSPGTPSTRSTGYYQDFLNVQIPLPSITSEAWGRVLPGATPETPLNYTHFSVIMNETRRMCYYTAVNIDGNQLRNIPRRDNWIYDQRIAEQNQCGNDIYAHNNLDRGHMVRRLDAVWGTYQEAKIANDDTFHYTNSCPQHANLNQREWNDLEEYILGNAGSHNLMVSVFTGPIFSDDDIHYRGIKIPLDFWKVVAFVRSDSLQLSVTAYQLTQKNFMDDIEEVFVFGPFRTYQVPVKKIESLTNIDFGRIRQFDPLNNVPEMIRGLKPLTSLSQIIY
jgi:endonuclease G, mitochondrial